MNISSVEGFFLDYIYIAGSILFTVYGQIVIKWRVGLYGILPELFSEKMLFILRLLLDPYIISGLLSAFLAALCWMAAMTKFELSHAYPFMGLTFVMVIILSGLLFNEALTMPKLIGVSLIVIGIIVGSQG